MGAARELLDFLLPTRCLGCDRRVALERAGDLVCPACRTRLRPLPHPRCGRCGLPLGTGSRPGDGCLECAQWPAVLERVRSAVVLEPPADQLVHGLKYEGWRELAPFLGERMARFLDWRPDPGAVVVPVPTTRRRERMRGYNQADLLAAEMAKRWGLPRVDALLRRRGESTQVSLQPSERRSNVTGVFSARRREVPRLRGRAVVLVDDVLTTGATLGAVACSLQSMGIGPVSAVTFARALPYRETGAERGR